MSAVPKRRMTFEEYEAFEAEAEEKHEFYRGEVFLLHPPDGPEGMAGATYAHVLLATRASRLLADALELQGCSVLTADMKVRLETCALSVYPDVTVVCGPPDFAGESTTTLVNPSVVVEVLSPSTETYDRGLKSECYRALPSLQVLVLVSQNHRRVEVFQREGDGSRWVLEEAKSGPIDVLGAPLDVDRLYAGLDLPDHAPRR